ncbi:MAG TPA: acyl-CoA dehydrogenase family protein [Caulobacteraceae bacterium]|nr:acyl-CoA dehydrogenase family protein [Caulobacteraceae bacterium]
MNLELTDQEEAFRSEVREFLRENLTPELRDAGLRTTSVFCDPKYSLPWQQLLFARGWVAPSWPVEHGGAGWSEIQRHIFAAECARAGAPGLAPMGLRMVGPCIIRFGTPEQKTSLLPRILSGEDYWCQGYSEPNAGSDLANLGLKADRDGDDYVLDGSKIWTTHAQFANRMFCLVRTRFDGKPQAGITFLLLDMATPGVTVRPIITLAGEHEVNQVFFEGVRVPRANRLGQENDGWRVAKALLEFERGGAFSTGLMASLARLRKAAAEPGGGEAPLIEDPAFRAKAASLEIELRAIEATELRVMSALSAGENPGPASSMLKAVGTEAIQRIDELWVEAAGRYGWAAATVEGGPGSNVPKVGPERLSLAMPRYLNNRAASIYGGTNEVQRNIIARLVLGL